MRTLLIAAQLKKFFLNYMIVDVHMLSIILFYLFVSCFSHRILLYYIILYYIILYYIILYHITLYYVILYYIILYHITLCHIILHYIILCHIILFHIVLYYIILYYIILYYIILYYIILYYIMSYYFISYYVILYYITLCQACRSRSSNGGIGFAIRTHVFFFRKGERVTPMTIQSTVHAGDYSWCTLGVYFKSEIVLK